MPKCRVYIYLQSNNRQKKQPIKTILKMQLQLTIFLVLLISFCNAQKRENSTMYICNTCNNLKFTYLCQEEKGDDTTCFVTEMFIVSFEYKKQLIKECKGARELIIENPSTIIYNLPFEKLKSIEKITFIGKDEYMDAVEKLPLNIFLMKSLRIIEFQHIRFPQEQLERLVAKYPHIEMYGTIKPYMSEYDKSISPELKKQFLNATY